MENLLREPSERAAYLSDPSGYLPSHGFGDFTNEDVELAIRLAADTFPPELAERLDPSAGLESVVAVDIDDLPNLMSDSVNEPVAFEDVVGEDDPFIGDDAGADIEPESEADLDDLDGSLETTSMQDLDGPSSSGFSPGHPGNGLDAPPAFEDGAFEDGAFEDSLFEDSSIEDGAFEETSVEETAFEDTAADEISELFD